MAYTPQTWTNLDGQPGDPEATNTANAERLTYMETGITQAHSIAEGKADSAHSHTLETAVPGFMFGIDWDATSSSWQFLGQTITDRPTARTDVRMHAYGGTTSPSFMIAGDIWYEAVS